MVGSLPGKAKRKEIDEVYDEFSSFSPATKMRRLDADFSSRMDDDLPISSRHIFKEEAISNTNVLPKLGPVMSQAMPTSSQNEELALVLYQHTENWLISSPLDPIVSFRVSDDIIQGLKNHAFKPGEQTGIQLDGKTAVDNISLALVPWVASQTNSFTNSTDCPLPKTKLIEDEEAEAVPMEIEDGEQDAYGGINNNGHWQQQCTTLELLPKASGPLMWSW